LNTDGSEADAEPCCNGIGVLVAAALLGRCIVAQHDARGSGRLAAAAAAGGVGAGWHLVGAYARQWQAGRWRPEKAGRT
jgi:hypothetical protein